MMTCYKDSSLIIRELTSLSPLLSWTYCLRSEQAKGEEKEWYILFLRGIAGVQSDE